MAKAAFIILRLATATAALLGLAGMVMVIVFTATVTMLKGGASIIAALATMIGSGFQRETSSPPPGPLTLNP